MHRGRYVDEFLDALGLLFVERQASFSGEFIQFDDVESYPKPLQDPMPILSGGNSPGSRRRAATMAHGWLPACLTPAEYRDGIAEIRSLAAAAGVDEQRPFEATMQLVVSVHDRHEGAVDRFRSSQVHNHLASLGASTMKGRLADSLEARNLVGTPDEVGEQVRAYMDAGVETFAGLLFATDTVAETLEAMQRFSEDVIAPLTGRGAA
jgi:alkanesulfonate monooxygenase SsuD/methylene tetrahydromethanopterin reductase-like flavin-dependent oxidoreductase (luciferase family)